MASRAGSSAESVAAEISNVITSVLSKYTKKGEEKAQGSDDDFISPLKKKSRYCAIAIYPNLVNWLIFT